MTEVTSEKVAILTSGGDSPGMNGVIASIILSARVKGIEVLPIRNGYKGLVQGDVKRVSLDEVRRNSFKAGTFIGSARYPEFKDKKVREGAIKTLRDLGVGSLVVIGGDGSYQGALALHNEGFKTIAIPATIDNDIPSSEFTIGFDSALNVVAESVKTIRATADSHNRIFLIEVMGHGCGDLALFGGVTGGADLLVTNELRLSKEEIAREAKELMQQGRRSVIVLISEFIFESLSKIAVEVEKLSGFETRAITLSHLQRGGIPTPSELIRAFEFGTKAVELISKGSSGVALGYKNGRVNSLPIEQALEKTSSSRLEIIKLFNAMAKVNK